MFVIMTSGSASEGSKVKTTRKPTAPKRRTEHEEMKRTREGAESYGISFKRLYWCCSLIGQEKSFCVVLHNWRPAFRFVCSNIKRKSFIAHSLFSGEKVGRINMTSKNNSVEKQTLDKSQVNVILLWLKWALLQPVLRSKLKKKLAFGWEKVAAAGVVAT